MAGGVILKTAIFLAGVIGPKTGAVVPSQSINPSNPSRFIDASRFTADASALRPGIEAQHQGSTSKIHPLARIFKQPFPKFKQSFLKLKQLFPKKFVHRNIWGDWKDDLIEATDPGPSIIKADDLKSNPPEAAARAFPSCV